MYNLNGLDAFLIHDGQKCGGWKMDVRFRGRREKGWADFSQRASARRRMHRRTPPSIFTCTEPRQAGRGKKRYVASVETGAILAAGWWTVVTCITPWIARPSTRNRSDGVGLMALCCNRRCRPRPDALPPGGGARPLYNAIARRLPGGGATGRGCRSVESERRLGRRRPAAKTARIVR